ncbi:hypothetical protein M8J77_002960 [Diaphorina citri]|nr:hypothetical protein M8J77_002960 [Diaphorina citri]
MISHDTRINDVRMSSSNGSLTGFYFQLEHPALYLPSSARLSAVNRKLKTEFSSFPKCFKAMHLNAQSIQPHLHELRGIVDGLLQAHALFLRNQFSKQSNRRQILTTFLLTFLLLLNKLRRRRLVLQFLVSSPWPEVMNVETVFTSYIAAEVVPLNKVVSPASCGDYPLVAILPVLSKALERIATLQVLQYIEYFNIMDPYQSGFRRQHSTATALVKVTDDIRLALDTRKLTVLVLCCSI